MAGETSILGFSEAMAAEASLLLQVEDKGPELIGADIGYIGGKALGHEELFEIADASGNDGYGLI